MKRTSLVSLLSLGLLLAASPTFAQTQSFSFESSLEGWAADSTDTPVDRNWSITRSSLRANPGAWSLAHYIDNYNDATKIWIERPFTVAANRTYDVTVSWRFATPESSPITNWSILGAIQTYDPEVRSDFVTVGSTYNGGQTGWVWTNRTYSRRVTLGPASNQIWVALGLWGTWEVPRTYYVDGVNVTIRPAQ